MTELEKARQIIDSADEEIARLLDKRFNAVKRAAEYKKTVGLPVYDEKREHRLISEKSLLVSAEYRDYYKHIQQAVMDASKQYQYTAMCDENTQLVKTENAGYKIFIYGGSINDFAMLTGIKGRAVVVTDEGVPTRYSEKIANQLECAYIYTLPQGEKSKSIENYEKLLSFMLERGFTRNDCVVACGGGVVGDLAGFCAASYMRGIRLYNFPTTVLSQVDSSVGGKTAVNLMNIKNPVGAFYQPSCVVIDTDVLDTLDKRQASSGLAEALKMSVTSDASLFDIFEKGDIFGSMDKIIRQSVAIKKQVVELDEKEKGLRKILNFGHTAGHTIEAVRTDLLHGECVALGMLAMCSEEVRQRLIPVYARLGLKTQAEFDLAAAVGKLAHDKKGDGEKIDTVFVNKIGECEIIKMSVGDIAKRLELIREGA